MLKYEWKTGAGSDPTDPSLPWKQTDGSKGKERNDDDLPLAEFAEKTENYFRNINNGISSFSVRIIDTADRTVTLWGGDTKDGFRFYNRPMSVSAQVRGSRRFRG